MPFFLTGFKLPPKARSGRLILGLGLGGFATACGAFTWYRLRIRSRGNQSGIPLSPSISGKPDPAPASRDWVAAGRTLDNPVPAAPDPTSPDIPVSGSTSGSEPWLDALRLAMEKKPLMFGYDRSAWTAPLLVRYLRDTQGMTVPVPRLRSALKALGYHWRHTHYVRAAPGRTEALEPRAKSQS